MTKRPPDFTIGKAERDEALALLREVREKGLIYWEPNTERGHIAKADLLARIDALVGDTDAME